MTILDSSTPETNKVDEPIDLQATREERRLERQRRRTEKALEEGLSANLPNDPVISRLPGNEAGGRMRGRPAATPAPEVLGEAMSQPDYVPAKKKREISWTAISFILMVMLPASLTGFYYLVLASPQYQVETQFSVRGSSQSSMATLGLSGLLGSTSQSGDSYIVTSYVESLQLIRDVKSELGIDLRQYYARDNIDFWYRIRPDMPLEQFTAYWRDMINVSFNSTTGNTTLYIYGFSADDTKAIADAVLKVSERLVNELSENSRQQLTAVASKQVDRAEQRMREVRESMRKLRIDEKALDPAQMAGLQNAITSNIQQQITELKTKLTVLLQSVSKDAPSAKVMRRQLNALEAQLTQQQDKLGPKTSKVADKSSRLPASGDSETNLAEAMNKFEELTVEQGFATQAYTTALAAFETSLAEAQKQERYFATFVAPTRPEIALYPLRWMDTFIAFLVLAAFWMISQFLFRSFRDHAI